MWHGMFLFLLGLVTGTRNGASRTSGWTLSEHLEDVMKGTFLMALGAGWRHVELPPAVERAARWTALYGTYGNWLFTSCGRRAGYRRANPTLSEGHHGKPWQERGVLLGFRGLAYAFLTVVVLILWGLTRRQASPVTIPVSNLRRTNSTTPQQNWICTERNGTMRLVIGMTGAIGNALGIRLLEVLGELEVEPHLSSQRWARATMKLGDGQQRRRDQGPGVGFLQCPRSRRGDLQWLLSHRRHGRLPVQHEDVERHQDRLSDNLITRAAEVR